MEFDADVRYATTHEWARLAGDEIVVGVSDYAQSTLSDVVYVELPEVGDKLTKGEQFGVVESVKAAGDIYAPASGTVVAVNSSLEDAPELVNQDPFGEGWLVRVKLDDAGDLDDLLDAAAYQSLVEAEQSA